MRHFWVFSAVLMVVLSSGSPAAASYVGITEINTQWGNTPVGYYPEFIEISFGFAHGPLDLVIYDATVDRYARPVQVITIPADNQAGRLWVVHYGSWLYDPPLRVEAPNPLNLTYGTYDTARTLVLYNRVTGFQPYVPVTPQQMTTGILDAITYHGPDAVPYIPLAGYPDIVLDHKQFAIRTAVNGTEWLVEDLADGPFVGDTNWALTPGFVNHEIANRNPVLDPPDTTPPPGGETENEEQGQLPVTHAPEPGTAGLLLIGAAGLIRRRR